MDNRGGTRRYRVPQQLIGSEKYTEMAERLINGPDHEYWLSLAKDLVLNDNRYKVSQETPSGTEEPSREEEPMETLKNQKNELQLRKEYVLMTFENQMRVGALDRSEGEAALRSMGLVPLEDQLRAIRDEAASFEGDLFAGLLHVQSLRARKLLAKALGVDAFIGDNA